MRQREPKEVAVEHFPLGFAFSKGGGATKVQPTTEWFKHSYVLSEQTPSSHMNPPLGFALTVFSSMRKAVSLLELLALPCTEVPNR